MDGPILVNAGADPHPPKPPIRTTKDLKAAHHLSSGGASGLASAITLQPLDLLKTRLQQAYATEAKGAKRCVWPTEIPDSRARVKLE